MFQAWEAEPEDVRTQAEGIILETFTQNHFTATHTSPIFEAMSDGVHTRFDSIQRWGFNLHILLIWLSVLLFTFVMLQSTPREINFPFGIGLAVHGILLLMYKTGMTRFERLPVHHSTGMLDELELSGDPEGRIVGLPAAMMVVGVISGLSILAECIFCAVVAYDELDNVISVVTGGRSFSWVILADLLCIVGTVTAPLALIYTALSFRRKAIATDVSDEGLHGTASTIFRS